MEDSKIIGLYLDRDENAVKETAAKYGGYCYSIAFRVLNSREDSEESVNDTYLEVWNSIPPHVPEIFSAFIGKITRRSAISRLRKKTAAKRGGGEYELTLDELSECIPDLSDPQKETENKIITDVLNSFLRDLKETERNVFIRRYWHMEPVEVIAGRFSFSESKVKSMLMRTRNKLKNRLIEEGIL